jgi:hypothetical protein
MVFSNIYIRCSPLSTMKVPLTQHTRQTETQTQTPQEEQRLQTPSPSNDNILQEH